MRQPWLLDCTNQMLDYKSCRQIASFNRTRKANGCMPSAQGLTEI